MSPDVQTRVLELGSFLHPTVFPIIFNAYRKTITSKPKLYGMVYRSHYKRKLGRLSQLALHRIFYAQTSDVIRTLKPNAIVCTHPFPNAVVSRLKRSSGLNVPLCTVITDYDAHGTWVSSETNRYFVSTEEVKDKLVARGVPEQIIQVTGIPVHPNFWKPQDKAQVRKEFGLKEMPTVLVMGGGWGIVRREDQLRNMVRWKDKIQFIFVTGNNQKALEEMKEDPAFQHEHVKLIGFTREIDKLMEVSDLLITKPGGLTCTEALIKGLPMLFYEAIPGQEEENAQYFISNGLGETIQSFETIETWFNRLIHQYDEVLEKRQLLSRALRRYNPEDCSRAILEMIQ
jgi:processive 1,2-diacylglycerol beta-glucosyltransferase